MTGPAFLAPSMERGCVREEFEKSRHWRPARAKAGACRSPRRGSAAVGDQAVPVPADERDVARVGAVVAERVAQQFDALGHGRRADDGLIDGSAN